MCRNTHISIYIYIYTYTHTDSNTNYHIPFWFLFTDVSVSTVEYTSATSDISAQAPSCQVHIKQMVQLLLMTRAATTLVSVAFVDVTFDVEIAACFEHTDQPSFCKTDCIAAADKHHDEQMRGRPCDRRGLVELPPSAQRPSHAYFELACMALEDTLTGVERFTQLGPCDRIALASVHCPQVDNPVVPFPPTQFLMQVHPVRPPIFNVVAAGEEGLLIRCIAFDATDQGVWIRPAGLRSSVHRWRWAIGAVRWAMYDRRLWNKTRCLRAHLCIRADRGWILVRSASRGWRWSSGAAEWTIREQRLLCKTR